MEILGSSTYLNCHPQKLKKKKKVLPGINWTSIEIMEILFDSETLHDHKKKCLQHEENCIPLVCALIYYYDEEEEEKETVVLLDHHRIVRLYNISSSIDTGKNSFLHAVDV